MKTIETKIYVGTRKTGSEISETIGRQIAHLNEGLSKKLRSSVLSKGIKKTEQGKRLEFLVITNDELKKFGEEIEPLVTVDGDNLQKKLADVNSQYKGRMDYATAAKYDEELIEAMAETVTVIGADKNLRKEVKQVEVKNKFKVGDTFRTFHGRHGTDTKIITRVTEKSYWYKGFIVAHYDIQNTRLEQLKKLYKGVTGWESADGIEKDIEIPYKGNERYFTAFGPETGPKRFSESDWIEPIEEAVFNIAYQFD